MVLPIENPTKSYWIEAAQSPLRNFRTTTELPLETDVVIIGSGYTGTTAAYWIHKYTENTASTPKMLMLEARDVCGGATGRNGGHLRPRAYTHYPSWCKAVGHDGAMELIRHEMAHLDAFKQLLGKEGLSEEARLEYCETFDTAMTAEGWEEIKGAYDSMIGALGPDGETIKDCRLITDPKEAEEATQMKGAIRAIVYPAAKIWPYKFVHALLRIVLQTGSLNLQANTTVVEVSSRDASGWITVKTPRGEVRTRAVLHATNRWAPHLLPEFTNLIFPSRTVMAAIKAPPGLMKRTGAQFWDDLIYNYYGQVDETIIVGGGRPAVAHNPRSHILSDEEDKLFEKAPEFYQSWAATHIADWPGQKPAELARPLEEGGLWSGVMSSTVDSFPFVGEVPDRSGHFIAAGYGGHGMPRILLATAHITPLILESLGIAHSAPDLVASYPPLPKPFKATRDRVERLQNVDSSALFNSRIAGNLESAKKPFCVETRAMLGLV